MTSANPVSAAAAGLRVVDGGRSAALSRRDRRAAEDRRLIDRAQGLFLQALPRRLFFAEVAVLLETTPEALRAAYRRLRLSPREHLREARLRLLHEDLSLGRFDDLRQALRRWGFASASPNAVADYRRLYSRHPQETLDAAREGARASRSLRGASA